LLPIPIFGGVSTRPPFPCLALPCLTHTSCWSDAVCGAAYLPGTPVVTQSPRARGITPRRRDISLNVCVLHQLAGLPTQGQWLPARTCRAGAPHLLPNATATARPRSGLYCRLSTDLVLFDFVHAGCAYVSLASRTSQRPLAKSNPVLPAFTYLLFGQVVAVLKKPRAAVGLCLGVRAKNAGALKKKMAPWVRTYALLGSLQKASGAQRLFQEAHRQLL
jgi:hypothetical protein